METRKVSTRKRVRKRFEKIARKHGLATHQVEEIFASQFKFARDHIEALDEEDLKNMTFEELTSITFGFKYIGKVHGSPKKRAKYLKRLEYAKQNKHNTNK